jgi:hypothetical protein
MPATFDMGDKPDTSDTEGGSAFDYITKFGKSSLQSIPELIGYTPSPDVMQFRQDYPISGIASEILPMAIPYGGWAKAAGYIPKLPQAIKAIGSIAKSPIARGALESAATFAPFEAGRVAISQIPGVGGDKSFPEMLGEGLFDTAAIGGIGGVIGGLAAAGTRENVSRIFPGLDVTMPPALQARKMSEIIDSGSITDPDVLARAKGKLNDTLKNARLEELGGGKKYVAPLVPNPDTGDAKGAKDLQRQFERLFHPDKEIDDDKALMFVRRFAQGDKRDFNPTDGISWDKAVKEAALPDNFPQLGQYFRHISFNSALGQNADHIAAVVNRNLTRGMTKIGDATFMSREADDGLYIMAKKINGSLVKPDGDDAWVLFKTDDPSHFAPMAADWAKGQVGLTKWTPGANLAGDGGTVYNAIRNLNAQMPLRNYRALEKAGGIVGLVSSLMPQGVRGAIDNEAIQRMSNFMREYFAPRQFQFKNERAQHNMLLAKTGYDAADAEANLIMNGKLSIDEGKNLFFEAMKNQKEAAYGINPVRNMPPEAQATFAQDFTKIWNAKASPADLKAMAERGEISPESRDYWLGLDAMQTRLDAQTALLEKTVGRSPRDPILNTYGLPRVWEGDSRFIIKDPNNNIVALASGANRKAAMANRDALIRQNPGWEDAGEYSISQIAGEGEHTKFPKGLEPIVRSPSWMLERQNIRGHMYDTKPPTIKEFFDGIDNSIRGQLKYQANLAVEDQLGTSMSQLHTEDPTAFRMLQARLNDYAGVQSAASKWQNTQVDRVFAPIFGPNSATAIVRATSTGLFNFQLGALKLAYPIINALQFVQTVIPEAAFMMSAPESSLAKNYTIMAAGGTRGPVGGFAFLNPVKMMGQSVVDMVKPSKELSMAIARAGDEGVIEPRVVENYMGESRAKILQNPFSSKDNGTNFVEWLRALSEWLPAESERMSRTHAFTVGHRTADYIKLGGIALSDEQKYQFAREFTEKTMYLYNAADKPRVFTTPAGSMMGLFKNWMFNYMASMGQYTHEGLVHNNWSPLMWQTAGTFALGGLAATPAMYAADQVSRYFSHKSAMEMAYEQFGQGGDAVMLGLPAALTGISLYSGVNTPLSNPTRDAASLFSVAAWDRVKQAGSAVQQAFDKWSVTGEHPGTDPGVRQLMARAFAPTTIYRTMAAWSKPESIVQMGTDFPLVKDVPPIHRFLYGLGFNPVELDRGMMISQELYAEKQKMQSAVKKFGDAWSDASLSGNSEQMSRIMRQAIISGVDVSSVIHSGMRNLKKAREDVIERQLTTPRKLKSVMEAVKMQRGQMSEEEE